MSSAENVWVFPLEACPSFVDIKGVRYRLVLNETGPPAPEPVAEPRVNGMYVVTRMDGTLEFWERWSAASHDVVPWRVAGQSSWQSWLNIPLVRAIRGPITPEDALRGVEART